MVSVQPTKRGERIKAHMIRGAILKSGWLLYGDVAHQATPESVAAELEPPACTCGAIDTAWEPAYVSCVCDTEPADRDLVIARIAGHLARRRWAL